MTTVHRYINVITIYAIYDKYLDTLIINDNWDGKDRITIFIS